MEAQLGLEGPLFPMGIGLGLRSGMYSLNSKNTLFMWSFPYGIMMSYYMLVFHACLLGMTDRPAGSAG